MKTILYATVFFLLPVICLSQNSQVSVYITEGLSNNNLKQKIESNTAKLLSVINATYLSNQDKLYLSNKYATEQAIEKLQSFWDGNIFYCDANIINEQILYHNNILQIRNIPIVFGENERLYVVLEYSSDGKVDDLFISLDLHQYKKVLESKGKIDKARREIILNFIENLRTSYIRKDIDVIEKLYSDKALIITGKVIQQLDQSVDFMRNNFTENQVQYQVMTKQQYIERLEGVFNDVGYIRLDFSNVSIKRHRKFPNYYGVQLYQNWSTSKYEDNGILFILIQFKEDDNPLIWVRTWQNADSTSDLEVFGLHNFKITQGEILK